MSNIIFKIPYLFLQISQTTKTKKYVPFSFFSFSTCFKFITSNEHFSICHTAAPASQLDLLSFLAVAMMIPLYICHCIMALNERLALSISFTMRVLLREEISQVMYSRINSNSKIYTSFWLFQQWYWVCRSLYVFWRTFFK